MNLIARIDVRDRLKESEKQLSQNIYEPRVDDAGFGRIRSKGDQALFCGKNTSKIKGILGVKDNRPLADFLPTLTIAAKNLTTKMTNYNVNQGDLHGEDSNWKEAPCYIYGLVLQGARAKKYEAVLLWLSDCGLIHKVHRINTQICY